MYKIDKIYKRLCELKDIKENIEDNIWVLERFIRKIQQTECNHNYTSKIWTTKGLHYKCSKCGYIDTELKGGVITRLLNRLIEWWRYSDKSIFLLTGLIILWFGVFAFYLVIV